MERVRLIERLRALQRHELCVGRDIISLTPFMDNKGLLRHIETIEQGIAQRTGAPAIQNQNSEDNRRPEE